MLVVGAGPYGFAAAGELAYPGFDVVVVGEAFATWHRHTLDGMLLLRSDPRASSIYSACDRWSFLAFLAARGHDRERPVPVTLYREYLREVAAGAPFAHLEGWVERLEAAASGFRARLAEGREIFAAIAVLATGLGDHRHLPPALSALGTDRLLLSWETEAIQRLEGLRVLVVGGGQSAGETVECLHPGNRVTRALRSRPLFFREPLREPPPVFKLLMASSRLLFRLPPAVVRAFSRPVFRTTLTPRLRAVWQGPDVRTLVAAAEDLGLEPVGGAPSGAGVRAADGSEYDLVIAATGYSHTVGGFGFLDRGLAAALGPPDAPPRVDAAFESGRPGLFVIGASAEAVHGPAMRLMIGARQAARRVAARIERRLGRRSGVARAAAA